ncbi:hypothetical protein [Micromonospora aurantiaca]|uniref:hypothetical protein n=1 Tax=Micromonospora aurantiaca (nom. illeg.) TaxID=47850 RepID=UPI001E3BF41F|nr:hypothetical protein [Micromonospora aurantiaca]UFN92212.1 hypothetical protein LF814_19525 [Micromonospora aurantiaca]
MVVQRITAGLLLLIGFLAMAASHTFPFLDDLSEPAESAVAIGGAACLLAGGVAVVAQAGGPVVRALGRRR